MGWWHKNGYRDPFAKEPAIKRRCPQRPIWYDKRPAGYGTYEAADKVADRSASNGREGFLDRANAMPVKGSSQAVGTLTRTQSLPAVRIPRTPVSERDLPYSVREEGDVRDPRIFRVQLPPCCYAPAHRTRLGLV